MRFITTEYERSHSRKPRGRGLWWFAFQCGHRRSSTHALPGWTFTEVSDGPMTRTLCFNGSYTEAKRDVAKRLRNTPITEIHVCP